MAKIPPQRCGDAKRERICRLRRCSQEDQDGFMGQKDANPWGPQVDESIFPFTNRVFWVPFFDPLPNVEEIF